MYIDKLVILLEELKDLVTNKDGKFSPIKVVLLTTVIVSSAVASNFQPILDWYEEHTETNVREKLILEWQLERQKLLAETLVEVVEPLADYINPDLLGVFKYFPKGKRTYNKLIYYVGDLPKGTTIDDYQRILTETTHPSVIAHSQGIPYRPILASGDLLPIAQPLGMYVYGCPIYNKDAVYDGVIAFYWYEMPEEWDDDLMYSSCTHAAREVGMYI